MRLLNAIRAYFTPEPEPVVPVAEAVNRRRKEVTVLVEQLLAEDGAELHSSTRGDCLYFAAKLREVLLPKHPDMQMHKVVGHEAPVIHYHLRTPEKVIVDPTSLLS